MAFLQFCKEGWRGLVPCQLNGSTQVGRIEMRKMLIVITVIGTLVFLFVCGMIYEQSNHSKQTTQEMERVTKEMKRDTERMRQNYKEMKRRRMRKMPIQGQPKGKNWFAQKEEKDAEYQRTMKEEKDAEYQRTMKEVKEAREKAVQHQEILGAKTAMWVVTCGNGFAEADWGEQCDDGNTTSGDGCSASCQVEYCGDAIAQTKMGEQCDDGNIVNNDGCSSNCELEYMHWRR